MSKRAPLISFCIATHNRGPILLECLQKTIKACAGLGEGHAEILLVDNASTDGTPELVRKTFAEGQVQVIALKENRGPVAKNFAMQRPRGEFLVLLDDDAYPLPGAIPQMLRHFRDNQTLGAAVFDVTLPDGSKEASAYPDVFIGAGTGLRVKALKDIGAFPNPLPMDFFMQAEEYDLSFRLLNGGYSVQRFWDLPLLHLKSPGARIAQRTTRLDVRNNLGLLAKYVPAPLCHELAADWLARYWMMALNRDRSQSPHPEHGSHKQAYLRGAAEGLGCWTGRRGSGRGVLKAETVEQIFKFAQIEKRLGTLKTRLNPRRILFADLGKNMLAYFRAAQRLGITVGGIIDSGLAGTDKPMEYRGIPIAVESAIAGLDADVIVVSNMSPIHGPRRAAALKRSQGLPVVDLFSRADPLLHSVAGNGKEPSGMAAGGEGAKLAHHVLKMF